MAPRAQGRRRKKARAGDQHADATNEATSETSPTKCYLTSLPYEIREMIYKELFRDTTRIVAAQVKSSLPFLFSCRTIFQEATSVLARESELQLWYGTDVRDLPVGLREVYLPHIQRLKIWCLDTYFPTEDLPSLRQVSISEEVVFEVSVRKHKLEDMVRYFIGDEDDYYIDQWISTQQSLAQEDPILPGDDGNFARRWQYLQNLDHSIEIITQVCVTVQITNLSTDTQFEADMHLNYNLRTSAVEVRRIDAHYPKPNDRENLLKSLIEWERLARETATQVGRT